MKSTLLKISMLTAVVFFVFAGASWAHTDKGHRGQRGSAKRIYSKHHDDRTHYRPVHSRQHHFRHHKQVYKGYHTPFYRHRHHKINHRNKWIKKHRRHMMYKWHRWLYH